MYTQLSSELNAIEMRFNTLFDDLELLDEAIVRYIDDKGGEYLSYRSYFDRKFPEAINALKGVNQGIKTLCDLEDSE